MKFSLMTPTRGRIKLLSNFLASVEEKTKFKNNVEVLIVYDDDDEQTKAWEETIRGGYDMPVKIFSVPRSENFNRDYYNFLAAKSTGNYLMICNDDCEFVTEGWDVIAAKKIEEKMWRDRIAYIRFGDGETDENRERWQRGKNYACFPLITREAYKHFGEVLNEQFVNWGADIFLWEVFNSANRIIDVPEVEVIHRSFHTHRRERDDLNRRVEEIYRKYEKTEKPALHLYLDKMWRGINGN